MTTCAIIDDQIDAVELLTDHVNKIPGLMLILATTDPIGALSYLEKEKVDLVFLDIQMPNITGLEFIESLKEKMGKSIPQFVLTTGYDQYALKSYEYGVFDYLLKPVSFARLKKTVDRFSSVFQKPQIPIEELEFFFAEVDGKKIKFNFSDIVYVEGAGNYVYIGTFNKKIIIYKSMNAMQSILPEKYFIRIHKSYIIAINKIHAIKGNEIFMDVKDEPKGVALGITYRENVLKRLKIGE